jgi:hypothetical protein
MDEKLEDLEHSLHRKITGVGYNVTATEYRTMDNGLKGELDVLLESTSMN